MSRVASSAVFMFNWFPLLFLFGCGLSGNVLRTIIIHVLQDAHGSWSFMVIKMIFMLMGEIAGKLGRVVSGRFSSYGLECFFFLEFFGLMIWQPITSLIHFIHII